MKEVEKQKKPLVSNDGPNFSPNFKCFVATACYGQDDYITDSLRVWRDKILSQGTEKGKILFIRAYYSFLGRPGASILEIAPFLKPIAKKAINWFIKINGIKLTK